MRRDPEHRYWLDDHLFPVSITGVLAHGKGEVAMGRIEATRQVWAPRGNACHRAMELFLTARRCEPPKVNSDPLLRLGNGPDVHTESGTRTRACASGVAVLATIDDFSLQRGRMIFHMFKRMIYVGLDAGDKAIRSTTMVLGSESRSTCEFYIAAGY